MMCLNSHQKTYKYWSAEGKLPTFLCASSWFSPPSRQNPFYFPGKCQSAHVCCIHRLRHLDHVGTDLTALSLLEDLEMCHRITHTGHQRSSVPSVRSDHLGVCKEWGQKWAPSFWKMPQRKEITINRYWAGNSIFRKYKHNSVSSNIKDPGHFFGMQELIVKGLRCDLCSFSWG